MSVVHFSTWILGIEKQKLKVRAIIHHLKIWNLTLQMSFTGSRGSFLGDSHFYGKQGFNFYTETKTVTSLWRSDDAEGGKVVTAMPVQNK